MAKAAESTAELSSHPAEDVAALRASFETGVTRPLRWRRAALLSLRSLYSESTAALAKALVEDLGGGEPRLLGEMLGVLNIDMALEQLDGWAADRPAVHEWALGRSFVRPEPKGVVLIIGAYNFPVKELLEPLVGALAAGNVALLKPSDRAPATGALLAVLVRKYLPRDAVRLVQGGAQETAALLTLKFDHIVFTGSARVGRLVMDGAARHLTPVTLECGGKSPVFVDRSANIRTAVARMLLLKYIVNAGQICIAPDYVLVDHVVVEDFTAELKRQVEAALGTTKAEMWHGDTARQIYGRILDAKHVERLRAMVCESGGRLVLGRVEDIDEEALFFPPMCILRPRDGSPLLTNEVFGPILSIVPVADVEEALERSHAICRSPLSLYIFAEDPAYVQRVLEATSSGMVGVNDASGGAFAVNLPFGGVGSSGFGAYGGQFGFEDLSHHRAICVRSTASFLPRTDLPLPSRGKFPTWMYALMLRVLVTGFAPQRFRPLFRSSVRVLIAALLWRLVRRPRVAMVAAELLRWLAAALGGAAQMLETTQQHPG
mmetsp:Transcript_28249/g.86348  ORF Transcript_28249/g.86348 Transcript_28249/m.86348 type:complete len:547 (+) Transcript_28249:100-1740(+)